MIAVPLLGALHPFLGFLALIAAITLIWKGNPWRRGWKVAATIAALALLGAVAPDPPKDGAQETVARADSKREAGTTVLPPVPSVTASRKKEPKPPPTAPDYRGLRLDKAQDQAQAEGFIAVDHDASDDNKDIWARSNWTVCFQETSRTSAGTKAIDFAAVQTGSPCPEKDGAAIPWPTMPGLVWKTWKTAHKELMNLKVTNERVRAEVAYSNDLLPDTGEYDDWRVCAHDPVEDADITTSTWVTLSLTDPDNGCPEPNREDGKSVNLPDRDKDGDPDYLDPFPGDARRNSSFPNGFPDSSDTSDGSSGGSSGGSVCAHTRWC